ncbi:right-handed parallel beta-helix repeat-containing protein [Acinetobacter baumannii]|nr:right-handed parallel beta-helix repeat-containing protein [Acinetobacter baumannii]
MKILNNYSFIIFLLYSNPVFAQFHQGSDITDELNNLISSTQNNIIYIPPGNYKIDAVKSINLKSNITIILDPKTTLSVIPNNKASYQLFRINNVRNVTISGGTLIGDKYNHLGDKGEWGMGIEIKDSQNISISNIRIDKMWGDAIYIGTNGEDSNTNIFLNNIIMNDNRRQGLSIISVKKLIGYNLYANNTSGTNPSSGIDIEPNNNRAILQDIYLKNIYTTGNQGSGLHSYFGFYKGSPKAINIKVENHVDNGSKYGFYMLGLDNKTKGRFEIKNANYKKSKTSNLCLSEWNNPNFSLDLASYKSDKIFTTNNDCKIYKNNKKIRIY